MLHSIYDYDRQLSGKRKIYNNLYEYKKENIRVLEFRASVYYIFSRDNRKLIKIVSIFCTLPLTPKLTLLFFEEKK